MVSSAKIIGGNDASLRQENDYYPTPPECTYALLSKELEHLQGMKVWECAGGNGAISKVLEEEGLEVYSSDLVDRGYGDHGIDFLWTMKTDCQAIITNPPFNLAEQFITHALDDLKVDYLAMLLKGQYWHAKKRAALFERHPPAVVYPMTWRPDFMKRGSPTMDFQWSVWRPHKGGTLYQPMAKV